MPWYRKLHWQIILALVLGLAFGLFASQQGWGKFTNDWIKPWGTIFINLLKMIAVPLVLTSLITGVASLSDMTKLSRIGGKTLGIYVGTTVLAITIGLVLVNGIRPGNSPELQANLAGLVAQQGEEMEERQKEAQKVQAESRKVGPLKPLIDVVPENVLGSAGDNRNLLQVVFVAILIGIGLIQIAPEKSTPVRIFFDGLNEVFIQLANLIMKIAPIGVFALIASVITGMAKDDPSKAINLLGVLGLYCLTVIIGLTLQVLLVYLVLLRLFTPIKLGQFFRAIRPAQLLAFSSSSSAATLPVTKKCCEENLGINPEVTSFSLPLGATVNMDGTALYQAVAAVFIVQVLGGDLTIVEQITKILLPVTLASIGTAAVPSAGIIMLVLILQGITIEGKDTAGTLALILGVDRILDMMRTTTNVTGDAVVTTMVAHTEGQLHAPDAVGAESQPPSVAGADPS